MFQAIAKGLQLAAPALIVAFVGAIGVNAGKEVGAGLGKWASERIWGAPPNVTDPRPNTPA